MMMPVALELIHAGQGEQSVVVAVTTEVSARLQVVRQLSGQSILLLVPDEATAARMLGTTGSTGRGDQPSTGPSAPGRGRLVVDDLCQQVTWDGVPLPLTRLERGLVSCLIEPPVRVWSYEDLYRTVWRDAWLGDTSTLHATVKRLRRKLHAAGVPVLLESRRGIGLHLRMGSEPATPGPPPPLRSG
jgi:DNA-binding response OmpR family regulator